MRPLKRVTIEKIIAESDDVFDLTFAVFFSDGSHCGADREGLFSFPLFEQWSRDFGYAVADLDDVWPSKWAEHVRTKIEIDEHFPPRKDDWC